MRAVYLSADDAKDAREGAQSRAVRAHATLGTCWHSLPMRTCCRCAIHCPKRTCLHSFPLPARTPPAHAKRDVSAFISALGRVAPTPFISQRACRHSFPPWRPVQSTPPSPARACCIHAKGCAGDVYEPPRRRAHRATCRARQNKCNNVHANHCERPERTHHAAAAAPPPHETL